MAWELTNGPIPHGLLVLHHCDNQACVRPDHLYLGTHRDNMRDATVRQRMAHGTSVWNHRLSEKDIGPIRALLADGVSTEAIGAMYGVSGRTIRYIRTGERWRHIN